MNFFAKNKFWIGIALSILVLIVLYIVLVAPKRRQVKLNVAILDGNLDTLEGLQVKGRRIATDEKIKECRKVADILKKQYAETLDYFPSREKERLDCWPKIIDPRTKKIVGALFKEKYKDESLALEKKLKKGDDKAGIPGIALADGVFDWVDFGPVVPQHELCVPAMNDFRLLEHISELILRSKAVSQLTKVTLGKKETLVLTVKDGNFYSRSLEISASVLYSKLLFLIEELHKSPKNIVVETISIQQAAIALAKGGEEPAVIVTMVCGMLQRGEKSAKERIE